MQVKNDISKPHVEITELSIDPAISSADFDVISCLAAVIWHDHYRPIIGLDQVTYMLERFQNPVALQNQIAQGYQYYLVRHRHKAVSYFAWLPDLADASLHLSKLYVDTSLQGRGLGRHIIEFIVSYCRQYGYRHIWLTVNRHNQKAIGFYQHMGFDNLGALIQDIGNGFVMDDFKMIKHLP
jgi:Acetyltransferases